MLLCCLCCVGVLVMMLLLCCVGCESIFVMMVWVMCEDVVCVVGVWCISCFVCVLFELGVGCLGRVLSVMCGCCGVWDGCGCWCWVSFLWC